LLPFTLVKTLYNRGSPRDLRGLIREPLRKVNVILLYHIQNGLPGEPSMIVSKQLVQGCQLFVSHGNPTFAAARVEVPNGAAPRRPLVLLTRC
jgi:hypothetical protein